MDSFIYKYTYLLTLICNPNINTHGSFMITCRHTQGGKNSEMFEWKLVCFLQWFRCHVSWIFVLFVGDLAVDSGLLACCWSAVWCSKRRKVVMCLKERITLVRAASFRVELVYLAVSSVLLRQQCVSRCHYTAERLIKQGCILMGWQKCYDQRLEGGLWGHCSEDILILAR